MPTICETPEFADEHDPTLSYLDWNSTRLLNPDGHTRWWNYEEFTSYGTIFGYTPPAFAIPNDAEWHYDLNPYKYFADELNEDDDIVLDPANRGTFSTEPGINSRNYMIQFGMDSGSPVIEFTYAVDASWSKPDSDYAPGYPVEAFDLSANCQEAYQVNVETDGTTLWYQDSLNHGGDLSLSIEVFDWQSTSNPLGTPGEVAGIYLSSDIDGIDDVDVTSLASPTPGSGSTSSVWTVDLADLGPYSPTDGYNRVLVTVESAHPTGYAPDLANPDVFDYPDAPLAAFKWVLAPIGTEPPPPELVVVSPNGGEVWNVGDENDIEWTAPSTVTDIKIEYSKDGFVADINEIIDTTPNDGVFVWEVPNDPSETVRVRVSEVGNPDNNDISDDDFTIFGDCTPEFTLKWSYDLPGNGFVDSAIQGGFTLADLEGDGFLEILVMAHTTGILYCFDHEGNIKWEFDCPTMVASWYSAPAVGEFTGDDILDVAISNTDQSGPSHNRLYVVDGSDGTEHFNISCGDIFNGMPSLGDVVGATNTDPPDGQLDIFVSRYDNPELFNACYNGIDGSLVWESRRQGWGYGVPALADMDLDGDLDCVCTGGYYDQAPNASGICVLRGEGNATERLIWESDHGSNILPSPALHDWTGDDIPDIIVRDYSAQTTECLDGADGSVLWQLTYVYSQVGSPALGDLNSDGYPDIVVGRKFSTVFQAINGDPDATDRILWSWADSGMDPRTGAVLYDVTCDGIPDVFASFGYWTGDKGGKLFIIDGETGIGITSVDFPDDQILFSTPAVGDIDNDGEADVVVGTMDNSIVYCYGLGTPVPTSFDARPWPMYAGNIRNTGLYGDEF